MNKYFNTEILQSLVALVPVDNQDLDKDRRLAMDVVARYVLYVSSNPSAELHPRKVKKNLRNLFGKKATSHGCVVRIREEKFSVPKLNITKMAEPKSLEQENTNEKPPDTISTSIIDLDKRARGGRNITFDPKIIFETECRSNWTEKSIDCIEVLHYNSKFICSSCSPRLLEMYKEKEKQVDLMDPSSVTSQLSIQRTSSESSREDDWNNLQLTGETLQQMYHLMVHLMQRWNGCHRLEGAGSYLDRLRNSDWEVIKWLCQNNFVGDCVITTSIESVSHPTTHSSHVEKFRNGLGHCLRIVGQFFSTGAEEEEEQDREHYGPLVLGPAIDECIAFLVDRVMIAIKWAMHKKVRPSDNAEEPEQLLSLPNGHRSTGEEEQQQLRNAPSTSCTSTHSLTRMEISVNTQCPRPMYLITQRKNPQC
ncbi:uncharacterized protein LOC122624587 [Drosophila teissieri]|uniref:uncharacterized protein LOC122624587 n=1 Tax=Drosophila teissieri TaxID=7243 RepID=UPI001CBA358C|nr:uncharacterized protein LOC122624587 [Drosophila teissieri]